MPDRTLRDGLGLAGRALVVALLLGWSSLFLLGILMDSAPYRKAISPTGFQQTVPEEVFASVVAYDGPVLVAWSITFLCYTPINLGILCLLAGILGTLGQRAMLHDGVGEDLDLTNPYFSALLRSFLIFLVLISGILLISDDPFTSPTPAQYLRLGGLISLMSFIANYQPRVFGSLLRRVTEVIESGRLGTNQEPSE